MKTQLINRKHLRNVMVLGAGLILLSATSTFAQTDSTKRQQNPAQQNPYPPAQTNPTAPKTMPMDTPPGTHSKGYPMDTSKKSGGYTKDVAPSQSKITPDQIKKIVGNDKPAGKDAMGHDLYQDASGRKYYVSDEGKKVYVK